jgi:hypothetical protein
MTPRYSTMGMQVGEGDSQLLWRNLPSDWPLVTGTTAETPDSG